MSLPSFMLPEAIASPEADERNLARAPGRTYRGSPGGGAAPGTIAGFVKDKQALPNWCWAAVSSGVDSVLGWRRSQCQIAGVYGPVTADPSVQAALQPPTCPPSPRVDTIGYLNEVLDLLQLSREPYRSIQSSDTTASDARTDIGAGRPVPIRISWSAAGDGHFIALIGTDAASGGANFVVYDPSETHEDTGQVVVRSEKELAQGYDGSGEWSHVYPVKRLGS